MPDIPLSIGIIPIPLFRHNTPVRLFLKLLAVFDKLLQRKGGYMKGQTIWVKDFHGVIHRRRLWSVGKETIYVTNDEQFDRLEKGLPALMPIGVP
jgi:hypothetical protein